MTNEEIAYEDVKEYEKLFTIAPPFIIELMLKRKHNLVAKFKSTIEHYMNSLTEEQKTKLNIILKTDIDDLQLIMKEAYIKTNRKQFKVLSNPKYKQAIESNLEELRKMVEN